MSESPLVRERKKHIKDKPHSTVEWGFVIKKEINGRFDYSRNSLYDIKKSRIVYFLSVFQFSSKYYQ